MNEHEFPKLSKHSREIIRNIGDYSTDDTIILDGEFTSDDLILI